jgi:flagellar protein FlbD
VITVHHGRERRPITVNADLIETVEATPDTIITLTSGKKLIVGETPVEVIALVVEFKRLATVPRLLQQQAAAAHAAGEGL